MNPLDLLFGQVTNAIQNHASPNTPGPAYDSGGILSTLSGLFGQHAQQSGQDFGGYSGGGGVESSNQDPYGDPGASNQQGSDSAFGNVASSDQDPYGDPGAQR